MQGAYICMTLKYNIEVPSEYSAELWKALTNKFNVILTKRQHSIDGEKIYIELKISRNI